jgi:hypothetical protein
MPTDGMWYSKPDLEFSKRLRAWEKHLIASGFGTMKAWEVSRRRATKGTWPPK